MFRELVVVLLLERKSWIRVPFALSLSSFVSFCLRSNRSLFSDLLGYWQYLDVETATFGKMYMDAMRKQEGAWTYIFAPCRIR